MNIIPGFTLINCAVILVSYFLILLVNKETRSKSAILLVAILSFHHLVAYLYAFHLSLPENEVDPASFVMLAAECTSLGYCGYLGEHLYANYLSKVLALSHSLYFVFLINTLLFVVSLYFFIGISKFFFLATNIKIYIFLYSMWPSVVYFTTMHYRETFELYLLIAGVYFGLTGSKSDSFWRMLVSMLLLLFMGIFHIKGLIFLSPVLFLIVICYRLPFTVLSLAKKGILLIIMSVVVYSSQGMYKDYLNEIRQSKQEARAETALSDNTASHSEKAKDKVLSGSRLIFEKNKDLYLSEHVYPDMDPGYIDIFMRKVTYYRASLTWVVAPETAFLSTISDRSIPAFIWTYSLSYIEYLFSPFIFQVNTFNEFIAYAESVLRFILFVSALVFLKHFPQARVLFLIYLAITSMWALGVISFGAGIRHHVQTNWILVLLGVPAISQYITNILNERKRANDKVKAKI